MANSDKNEKGLIFYLLFVIKKIYKIMPGISLSYFVFSLITGFLPQVNQYIFGRLLDSAQEALVSKTNGINDFIWFIVFAGVLMMVITFIYDIHSYISQIFNLRMQNARDELSFRAVLRAAPHYFEDPVFVAEKNKVDYNSWKITQVITYVITFVTSVITSIVMVIIFVNYDYKIVLTALISLALPTIVRLKYGKQVWGIWDSLSEDKVIYSKYRNNLYTDSAARFLELKVFSYGNYLLEKALDYNRKFVDKLEGNERGRLVATLFSRLWEFSFTVMGLYFVFMLFINSRVTIGQFFFIVSLFQSLRSTITFALENVTDIASDGAFFKTFYNYLNYIPKVDIKPGDQIMNFSKGVEIEFKNVSFKYPGTKNLVIKNVNIKIPLNSDVAFVGKNGAGKSTLIKLLLRIYDPTKGEILLNGVNIKKLNLDEYYKKVGILSQEYINFGFQVWENIAIGDTSVRYSKSRMETAAKNAQAHEFIVQYPKKYDTYLARDIKGGVQPSGGQWQRIAISRVFYRDPKLIVLDEPTSAIDALAEEQIFANIKEFSKEKTVVIVSHRFATVKKADYIYVVENGSIKEEGTHDSLMESDTLYSKMYISQNK